MRFAVTVLCLAAFAAAGCGRNQEVVKATAPQAVEVKTALAESRAVERSIMVTGSLQPDETVTVTSEVSGRVKAINYDFGQSVRRGQVVAELDTTELKLQMERVRATLAQALARVGLPADAPEDTAPESTPSMRQAKAQLDDARSRFERAEKLTKTGDIAQERFVEAEKALAARQAAYDMMRDDKLTQLAAIKGLRADLRLAEKRVRDATVVAPFDGQISAKHVSPGQYIKENVPIVTLIKTSPLRLRVEVPESAVGLVRMGTELVFTTEAVAATEFRARVTELNPALDSRSRTLSAEARLLAADARLKPGAFVQVRLVTSAAYPVIAIPKEAVYTVAGLNKFFTIEGGKAVEHKIPEILGQNGFVEIPEGLIPAGAQVAVSNVAQLTQGVPVKQAPGRS
jgi:membrane fusion protein, multidrug efflux system